MLFVKNEEILARVDHTALKATATWQEIRTLCEEALEYHTASVCIPPSYVARAHAEFPGLNICTVIGFPLGYNTTACKVFETQQAVREGASEVDMVVNLGDVKNGDFDAVEKEIEALKNHAQVLAHVIEVGLRIGDFDAVEEDGAGGRYLKGVDAAKHRALARSRRAEHNDLFARHDVEIDAVEHDMVAEGFLQILNGYDGFGHGS